MKKIAIFCSFVMVVMIIGCGNNISSQAEAVHEASQLPNFKKLISVESVWGKDGPFSRNAIEVSDADKSNHYYYIVHIVVYETKDGNVAIVRFDDKRPPSLILRTADKK